MESKGIKHTELELLFPGKKKKKIKTEKSKEKLSCLRSSRPTRILDSNIVAVVQALPCMVQQEC